MIRVSKEEVANLKEGLAALIYLGKQIAQGLQAIQVALQGAEGIIQGVIDELDQLKDEQ